MSRTLAMVAGEVSGDILGADLLRELKALDPSLSAWGIGGEGMQGRGFETRWPMESLSVMGLAEVVRHLPELLGIRRQLADALLAAPPSAFIGIDAPDFNLGLERRLKAAGIHTVHYVSPSVWAWRRGRAMKMANSADLVLCLFPFEPAIYAEFGVNAVYVGHPLADAIPDKVESAEARRGLGLDPSASSPVLALLPGSRMSEVSRLAPEFLATAGWLRERIPDLTVLVPAASPRLRAAIEDCARSVAPALPLTIVDGRSRDVMAAADAVLLASGTAALEAMLLKRPMVVSYRLNPLTFWIVRLFRLLKVPYVSLPNVLAGREVVPECLQGDARHDVIGPKLLTLLTEPSARQAQMAEFAVQHQQLRCNAGRKAAAAVMELING